MKVLTYKELDSKDGLLPLLDNAFGWTFEQHQFESFIKIDPRLKEGPVSFCAVENEQIIGHVGVMNIATRTSDGQTEYVGGIYGVATLPGHTRMGVSTTLMDCAHRYFKEKGYQFSFLGTSPALIAHAFYEKLGYTDLIEYTGAYKVIRTKKARSLAKKKAATLDLDKVLGIYDEFTRDKTGFIIRDKAYLKMLMKTEGIKPKQWILEDDGYVVFKEDKLGIAIRELVALNQKEMDRLVGSMEERAKCFVYDGAVLNQALLQVYKSRQYMIQERSCRLMMQKPLTTDASFKRTYGDKFFLSRLDAF